MPKLMQDPSVSVLEEIGEQDVSGGWWSISPLPYPVSVYLGNTGRICTWTYECQTNCPRR